MLCEKYKPALIEAAVTGGELSAAVRAHVDACPSCAAELTQQRQLIAAIDTNLHRQMNAPVPASMVQRLEAHLAQETVIESPRSSRRRWLYAAGAVVAVAAVMLLVLPHRRDLNTTVPHEPASQTASSVKQSAPTVTMGLKPATPAEIRRDRAQHAHLTARAEPEVIVPPDERIGLEQFIANLNGRADLPVVIVKPIQEQPEQVVATIKTPDIQTAALVVQPLQESTE